MHIDYLQHNPSITAKINVAMFVGYIDTFLENNFIRGTKWSQKANKSPVNKKMLKEAKQCLIPAQKKSQH